MKTCSKCGENKPFSDFHKRKSAKDGLKSSCKICRNRDNATYREANPDKVKASLVKYKERNLDRVKQKLKDWRAANLEKARERSSKWYFANKDRAKAMSAERYKNNKERAKEKAHARYLSDPSQYKIRNHKRRATLLRVGGKLSIGLEQKLYALQKGKCACCKRPLGDKYHMDHIMPLALGGSNTDDNIQLLRAQCNNQKYMKHPVDFMQERGYLL